LTGAAIDALSQPDVGANDSLYFSPLSVFEIGTIEITGADTCTYTPNVIGGHQLAAGTGVPRYLVAVADDVIPDAGAAITLTITGLDNAGTPASQDGTAAFDLPSYSPYTVKKFIIGFGVAVDAAAKYSSVTAVTVVCNAKAAGAKIKIYALPDLPFDAVLARGAYQAGDRSREDVPVREGGDPSAYVVEGDKMLGKISIEAASFNNISGLDNYVGAASTLLVENRRGGKLAARIFFTRVVVNGPTDVQAGNSAKMRKAEGSYVQKIMLLAPTT
jgi:hypothetical protein